MNEIQVTQILAEVATSACATPGIFEFAAIVALIIGSGIVGVSAGISIIGLATTIVSLMLAGANLEAIYAAIAVHLGSTAASIEVFAALYQGIKEILGC